MSTPGIASAAATTAGRATVSASARSSHRRCSPLVDRILRVDHAGELGADRIYAGQMAVLGRTSVGPTIQHMWDQEKEHKETFERFIPKYRARPTAFLPLWNIAGFALGAGSALLGEKTAMACTVAVETVITDHYNQQIRSLTQDTQETGEDHTELLKIIVVQTFSPVAPRIALSYLHVRPSLLTIEEQTQFFQDNAISKFRDDEMEHHDTGLAHDAEQAPAYRLFSSAVKLACRGAIWASERI